MGTQQVERLITLIENRGSLCGAAVVGQGSITFLFGHPHHASISGSQLTSIEAVREIARMAASGTEPTWDEAIRMGAGQSVDGVPVADILDAIRQAAAGGTSPGPASTPAPPPPAEPVAAAQVSPPETEEATTPGRDDEAEKPPATDLSVETSDASTVDVVTEPGVPLAAAPGDASSVGLPPAAELVAPPVPVNEIAIPTFDAPITLAGGPEDIDAEDVEAPAATATPAEIEPEPAPVPAAQPEVQQPEEPGKPQPTAGGSPHPATMDPDSMPPLIAGESILDETPVRTVDLDSFLLEDAPLQVVYRSTKAQGVALMENGRVHDALYLGEGDARYGRAAYEFIVGAREGTVRIAKIPRGVFEALPACWAGQLTIPDTPRDNVDLNDLNVGAASTLATAAIQITTKTDRGVVLYHGGEMVAAYTRSAPHRLMNEGALATLCGDDSAFVRVRTLRAEPPPPPAPPMPKGMDQEEWTKFVSSMALAVQARLHTHSGRVEDILQQTPPNRQGVATAAQVIRATVIRGMHPDTMRSIGDLIEAMGRARLPA